MDVFAPRDPRAATRALTVVIVVSAAVLAGYTAVSPPAGVVLALVVGVVVLLLAGALGLVLAPDRVPPWVHGAAPAAGVVVVACLDVATRDASTAAQVFFLLPVVYVAAHLGRAAAWGLTALAMAGEAVVTGLLLTPTAAVTDTVYLTAVAVTTTALLVRANRRTDELLAELRHLAAVDPLTGLVTRRVLDDAAACALTSADTDAGTSFVLVDVDRFKSVNDSFGHPAGDQVLCHVGEQLVAVVGAGAVVSRLGGDELAVLLPSTPVEVARVCAEAALARLRAHPLHLEDGRRVTVSASIGVAHAPVHARDLAGLYRAADAALYEAKRGGRDRVAVASGPPPPAGVPGTAPTEAPPAATSPTGTSPTDRPLPAPRPSREDRVARA